MSTSRIVLATAVALAAAVCTPLLTAPTAAAAPAKLADDFNGDGHRDFVMLGGTHGKDGRVTVVYGTSTGPGTRVQTIHQDSPGIPGAVEKGDSWGFAATSADLDRDGYADLIVDTNEQLDNTRWGMVHLLKGSKTGITGTGSKTFTVNSLKLSYKNLGGPFPH
ncbi:VCBS repeat-containing protein [Streptomyces sp. NWU339]|uniref:FG-GAP repeat domain-containing protein n=1 Tax=Streptomyces sp. NWU339 TaxID=2185284 RepID=UPI00215A4E96|nr:VCBS repeat-containing protein [Streptomyces sp. NWU339]